jgi:3-hydroxyisobutyrate dehydrogenase-like beta-hydroxyacid dehydrogenase
MENLRKLAFIGYGEVGRLFSQQLRNLNGVSTSAYDLKLDCQDTAEPLIAAAKDSGVSLTDNAAEAARDADVIISAVTADAAEQVAREAASYLKPGQIFFDINSAAPSTKSRAANFLASKKFDYVEGAVMAPVIGPGINVSILAGGGRAAELTAGLNALGMNLRFVSLSIGRASATKLCRSIMIKGIEALIIDSANACDHWGVAEDVFASLNRSFQDADWAALAKDMDQRVAKHGVRRAAEMREAAEMLSDLGRNPELVLAVADSHLRRASTVDQDRSA